MLVQLCSIDNYINNKKSFNYNYMFNVTYKINKDS